VGRGGRHQRADTGGRHRELASRGFGFVEVQTGEAANRAVAKLNGVQLDGRALRMEISKPSAPRSGGGYRPRNASGTSRERWYGTHAADV